MPKIRLLSGLGPWSWLAFLLVAISFLAPGFSHALNEELLDFVYIRPLNLVFTQKPMDSVFVCKIPLNDSLIDFNQALPSGADVRVFQTEGSIRPTLISGWSGTDKNPTLWVFIDSVHYSGDTLSLILVWGNASPPLASWDWAYMDTINTAPYTSIVTGVLTAAPVSYRIWDDGGTGHNWSTPANWSGDVAPGPTDMVLFNGSSSSNCILDISDTVRSIDFEKNYKGSFFFRAETLSVKAHANLNSNGAFSAGTGALRFLGYGAFTPLAGQTLPNIIISSNSRVELQANLTAFDLIVQKGELDLGEFFTHTVRNIWGSGSLNFHNSILRASGSVISFNSFQRIQPGAGSLDLTGTTPQVFSSHTEDTLPAIIHSGGATLILSDKDLLARSFTQTAGVLDLNRQNVFVVEDFNLTAGPQPAITELGGCIITAGRNAYFQGASNNILNLNPVEGWTLDVGGYLNAIWADIGNSQTLGSSGYAAQSSDKGGNNTWYFNSEDYSQWSYNRNIYLNTSVPGPSITSDITLYPLLISLEGAGFDFAQADSLGRDIRFTDEVGAPVHYYREYWSLSKKTGIFWVLTPRIKAGLKNQFIRMYWGNASVADNANPLKVFGAGSYQGVWHMDSLLTDASPNAIHAQTTTSQTVTSFAGRCQSFDGSQWAVFPDSGLLDNTSSFTLSAWIFPQDLDNSLQGLLVKRDTVSSLFSWGLYIHGGNRLHLILKGSDTDTVVSRSALMPDTWQHVAIVFNGQLQVPLVSFYLNGELDTTVQVNVRSLNKTSTPLIMGRYNPLSQYGFSGRLEEVRFSNTTRSRDWILFDYLTQGPGRSAAYAQSPVLSGIDGSSVINAYQSTADSLIIDYALADPDDSTVNVILEYSLLPGGPWLPVTSAAGDTGQVTVGTRRISWNARNQLTLTKEELLIMRLTASDSVYADTILSKPLLADFTPPRGLDSVWAQIHNETSVRVNWIPARDSLLTGYEILYNTKLPLVMGDSANVMVWGADKDPSLSHTNATTTLVEALTPNQAWYFKVRARDKWGNTTSSAIVNASPSFMNRPVWQRVDIGPLHSVIAGPSSIYLSSKNKYIYSLSPGDGDLRWSLSTHLYGDPGYMAAYINAQTPRIAAVAGRHLLVIDDLGSRWELLSKPLTAPLGVPYTGEQVELLWVAAADSVFAFEALSLTPAPGWPQYMANASHTTAPAGYNDEIFFPANSGEIKKFDLDGTPMTTSLSAASSPAGPYTLIETVDSTLYSGNASGSFEAMSTSNLESKWAITLNTLSKPLKGAVFADSGAIYVSAGPDLAKIIDNGNTAAIQWSKTLPGDIFSNMVLKDSTLYLTTQDGNYHALNTTDGSTLSGWPYHPDTSAAAADIKVTPLPGQVLFTTDNGRLDLFTHE